MLVQRIVKNTPTKIAPSVLLSAASAALSAIIFFHAWEGQEWWQALLGINMALLSLWQVGRYYVVNRDFVMTSDYFSSRMGTWYNCASEIKSIRNVATLVLITSFVQFSAETVVVAMGIWLSAHLFLTRCQQTKKRLLQRDNH